MMCGLYHQINYKDKSRLIDRGEGVFTLDGNDMPEEEYHIEIHDDLFRRFHDYFIWIETYNPVGPQEFNRGFNYYGWTEIRDENLVKFGKLIDSLLNLFENAPENIILTGDYCFDPPSHRGQYDRIKIKKDELLKIFGDLKNMTVKAIKNNGYLSHSGI